MRKQMVMAVTVLSLLASATASAADGWFDPNFRFGIGGGRLTVEMDDVDLEGNATAWEVFGGFEFNRYLAIEAGYIDGGKAKDDVLGAVVEADTSGLYASVIGSLPVNDVFSFYARAGILKWESDQEVRFEGDVLASADLDGTDALFGGGVAAMAEGALFRLEYRMASLDDSDISLISLAITWRF